MKKVYSGVILGVLSLALSGLLMACQTSSPLPSASKIPISTVPVESSALPETSIPTNSDIPQEGNTNPPLDEPPLDENALGIVVPDFLSAEQQDLYRRANSLYVHMLGSSIEYSETYDTDTFPPNEYETVQIGDSIYLISQGRYSNWDNFNNVVHSIFTSEFWDSYNTLSNGQLFYTEYDGMLCFLDTSKGIGYFYNDNFPDEFRLEEKTDSTIMFTLIGHYSLLGGTEGETVEQRENRLFTEYDYTLEFPIKMILTQSGWRFDEFYSTLVDERDQS